MSGFDKIEFDNKAISNTETEKHTDFKGTNFSMPKRKRPGKFHFSFKKLSRKQWITIGVIVAFLLISTGIPAYATYSSGLKTYREAKLMSDAFKHQDLALASEKIDTTQKALEETRNNFRFLLPYKFVPIIGWYYSDVEHMLAAGSEGLDTARVATDALEPYADLLGLKGEGSFTGGSAEQRIQTAVLAASKITPKIDEISDYVVNIQKEMEGVKAWHYPSLLFGKKIHDGVVSLKQSADEAATGITEAKPLIKALPALLGESKEKKYLIIFQNDKELRSTGGFMTAYAIFRVDKGVIHIDRSDDIYTLDASIPSRYKESAPAALRKYLKVSTLNLRDTNLSPDFIESMDEFNKLYTHAGQSVDVDGIIALDTDVLVKTIKILDDQITVDGITFTTKEDPRCDCPQVIYELENNISRPVDYIRTDRKSLIGDLLNAILVKALSSSPKIYWGPLFQTLISETNEKHILFYLYDNDAQSGIYALNAAGKIKEFEGDYLHINESNFSGAKVNIFLEHTIEDSYDIASDGTITKTVTIHYKNPYPASDCNLERGGLCLNSTYRGWVRIYVPKGSKLVDSKGSQVKVTNYDELGKTVFDGLASVRPQGVGSFSVTYTLPFKFEGGKLPALIQKQPGLTDPEYKIIVNGKTQETFPLVTDKEIAVKK